MSYCTYKEWKAMDMEEEKMGKGEKLTWKEWVTLIGLFLFMGFCAVMHTLSGG